MFYNNPEHKKSCVQAHNYIPCCDIKENLGKYNTTFLSGDIKPSRILLQLFDLKETLIQKKIIKFYAKGICMYPCVHPGDILHIEYKRFEEINIGDIAVYRRGNSLFGHRVIDRGYQEGSGYIVTRSDISGKGSDGPIFNDDIAGVVTGIQRKGCILRPEKIGYSLIEMIYLHFFITVFKIRRNLIRNLIYPITLIQYLPIYKQVLKLLLFRINKNLNFYINMPLNSNIKPQLNKIVSFEELRNLSRERDGLLKWAIVLNIGYKPVAYLSFMYNPKDFYSSGWWISEVQIRNIYHGSVIEEEIFRKADELLGALGVLCVSLSIPKTDHLHRIIFEGLGFEAEINDHNSTNGFIVLKRKIKNY